MKDCKKIHPLLPLFADEQLSSAEKEKVEKHLDLCGDARKELEQFRGLLKSLHQMPDPPVPADLHDKIMARLGGNIAKLPSHRGFWGAPAWALSAAAVLLLILLNQFPNWHDTLRVDKRSRNQDEANVSKESAAPPASEKRFAPAQPQVSGANAKSDLKSFGLADQEKSKDAKIEGGLYSGNEMPAESTSGYSANSPAPQAAPSGSALGKSELDIQKPMAAMKTKRAKKSMVALAPAAMEAPAPPAPSPTVEPLDKSEKSLTYSREESVTTWKGNNGPATVESQELVTDQETFQKYWNIPHPGEAPPAVDFTKDAVVILMAGGKPTAGYSIYVSRLEEKADQLMIHYKVDSPAPDAVTAQILTQPWSLQVIPKPSKPVVFVKDP